MYISNDIKYVGVNDHSIDLFEGQYCVPNGMSYNSYAIIDDKIAVMDTVEQRFRDEWLDSIHNVLQSREPNYLIVQHMEPDHSANIKAFIEKYPNTTIVATSKAFPMMKAFFGSDFSCKELVVCDGDTLSLGAHTLSFYTAPMVHWPEVMVTYDSTDKVLFSADGFGKFGALDVDEEWDDEARRYYIGIVGKYGAQVQALLKKASSLDIQTICSLHGPVLNTNISKYVNLYNVWSSYQPEKEGIAIAYTSVYSNTATAVKKLAEMLESNGKEVIVYDLARCDISRAVSDSFKYSKLVLATTTYNADIFPFMKDFINHLTERNFSNRFVGMIENGSWAPMAVKVMSEMLSKSKNLTFASNSVKILSSLDEESNKQLIALSNELSK